MNHRTAQALALAFVLGLLGGVPARGFAGTGTPTVRYTPPRGLAGVQVLPAAGDLRHPGLPDTLRLVAIRVEFAPDSLTTTTGDGSFLYTLPDSIAPEDWLLDPPPHDSTYFADQLYALRRYYEKFSRGKVTITGARDSGPTSGGDIFPLGEETAYRLPYPIWHINWGDGDDERLSRMLVQLFVDSWNLAKADPDFDPSPYDLFLIFHAGAGNEFDTGFDLTPHDIPSVTIGRHDLAEYAGLPDGLDLGGGVLLTQGAILPETQRQGNVEVALLGTICHHTGFLMGMPHMYRPETGEPSLGLFGLMDRGFGGFFGVDPTPPGAWMRAYMGWDSVTTLSEGQVRLGALHLPDSLFTDSLARLVKVPVNGDEYFLLEARRRDPDENGETVAWDREGRRLTLHEDYTFDAEPGYRVTVEVEDHDFDLPASGILIWHVDESVIRAKLAGDALQEDPGRRAVDLEEADGTQDLGEEYPFLTPGYGTEYGIREDAWYRGNELFKLANNLGFVEFSATTSPSTAANSGGASHIAFIDFSEIGDTMSCTVVNQWKQGDFPERFTGEGEEARGLLLADLDGDGDAELIAWTDSGSVWAWDGDGAPLAEREPWLELPGGLPGEFSAAAADLDGDGDAELVFSTTTHLVLADTDPASREPATLEVVMAPAARCRLLIAGGPGDPRVFTTRSDVSGSDIALSTFDGALGLLNTAALPEEVAGLALLAAGGEGRIGVLGESGRLWVFDTAGDPALDISPAGAIAPGDLPPGGPVAADFDGDGGLDLAAPMRSGAVLRWWSRDGWSAPELQRPEGGLLALLPADLDGDGLPEPAGFTATGGQGLRFAALEPSGAPSEGSPRLLPGGPAAPPGSALLLDLTGSGDLTLVAADGGMRAGAWRLGDERIASGFPLDAGEGAAAFRFAAGQLDGDDNLELALLAVNTGELRVVDLPRGPGDEPRALWAMDGGDAGRTGALISTAAPPAPPAGTSLDNAYIWPNPVLEGTAHFRFRAESAGTAVVKVFDMVGRKRLELALPYSGGGEVDVALSTAGLPSGVYTARLEAGGGHKLIRFAVVK